MAILSPFSSPHFYPGQTATGIAPKSSVRQTKMPASGDTAMFFGRRGADVSDGLTEAQLLEQGYRKATDAMAETTFLEYWSSAQPGRPIIKVQVDMRNKYLLPRFAPWEAWLESGQNNEILPGLVEHVAGYKKLLKELTDKKTFAYRFYIRPDRSLPEDEERMLKFFQAMYAAYYHGQGEKDCLLNEKDLRSIWGESLPVQDYMYVPGKGIEILYYTQDKTAQDGIVWRKFVPDAQIASMSEVQKMKEFAERLAENYERF